MVKKTKKFSNVHKQSLSILNGHLLNNNIFSAIDKQILISNILRYWFQNVTTRFFYYLTLSYCISAVGKYAISCISWQLTICKPNSRDNLINHLCCLLLSCTISYLLTLNLYIWRYYSIFKQKRYNTILKQI